MDVGTIGFHNEKAVIHVTVEKDKAEIKRVSKTKTEREADYQAEREERDARERADKKLAARERVAAEKKAMADRKAQEEARSYDRLFEDESIFTSNTDFEVTGFSPLRRSTLNQLLIAVKHVS